MQNIAKGSAILLPALLFAAPLLGETSLPDQKTTTDNSDAGYGALAAEQPSEADYQIGRDRELLEATRAISQYEDRILALETQEGAYSPGLSEYLAGLGKSYSKLGRYEEALQAYQRALLIYRSNYGLHNLGQEPYLEPVMDINETLGRNKSLNNNYDYLLWLYRRNYGAEDPRLLPALIRVASGKLEAFIRAPSRDNADYLYQAQELFEQSLRIVDANPDMDDRAAIGHLYEIAARNFNADFFMGSYQIGRDALQKIIDIHNENQALPRASLAQAWVLLGDWQMKFSNRGDATESYRNAYRILSEAGPNLKAINRLFGKPRSLTRLEVPNKPVPFEKITLAGGEATGSNPGADKNADKNADKVHINQLVNSGTEFVLAEFDVSSSGRVRDLEIIRSNPEGDVRFRRNARERILRVPFRPRLESGELVHTEDFVMVYKFQ